MRIGNTSPACSASSLDVEERKEWTLSLCNAVNGTTHTDLEDITINKFIYMSKMNRYGKKLMPLPVPKLVVFYNGEEEKADQMILRLSDSFKILLVRR